MITVRRTLTITCEVDIHVDEGMTEHQQTFGAYTMIRNWLDDNFDHMDLFNATFTEA